MSGLRGRYNPPGKCITDLGQLINVSSGNKFHLFCLKIMEVNEEGCQNVLRKGNTMTFKRTMKPYAVMGGTKQPCDAYLKLKKTLKSAGW